MRNKATFIIAISIIIAATACKNGSSTKNVAVVKPNTVAKKDTSHLTGMWLDEDIKTEKGEKVAYQIVTQGSKTYIQVITFSGKKLDVDDNPVIAPSASAIKKSGNKYISLDNASEIYMIDKTGDLLIYDATGFIARCKKLL